MLLGIPLPSCGAISHYFMEFRWLQAAIKDYFNPVLNLLIHNFPADKILQQIDVTIAGAASCHSITGCYVTNLHILMVQGRH